MDVEIEELLQYFATTSSRGDRLKSLLIILGNTSIAYVEDKGRRTLFRGIRYAFPNDPFFLGAATGAADTYFLEDRKSARTGESEVVEASDEREKSKVDRRGNRGP